jgi:hypothetical protein
MKLSHTVAGLCLTAALAGGFAGCDKSRDEMRPDMDTVMTENGLQSRDLREMTDKMAPDLLQIPQIVNNPYKVTIVVKGVRNGLEGEQGRDIDIFVARLAGLLNSSSARDRISFVEERATVDRMAAQELGNRDPFEEASRQPMAPSPSIQPQFALYGEFRSMRNSKTTYYLCQFKLTNLTTREIVWQNQYETRTLNLR